MSTTAQIPGYAEAVEREQSNRDASFVIDRDEIAGIEVVPMAARHFLILDGCGSPFLGGGLPTETDIGIFLWVMQPNFRPGDIVARDAFAQTIRTIDYATFVLAIREFIDDALADSPAADGGRCGRQVVSWVAHYVDLIAREYHWSEAEILSLPLKRLFQYVRKIQGRLDDKAIFINRSDEVRAAWLRAQNEKPKAE